MACGCGGGGGQENCQTAGTRLRPGGAGGPRQGPREHTLHASTHCKSVSKYGIMPKQSERKTNKTQMQTSVNPQTRGVPLPLAATPGAGARRPTGYSLTADLGFRLPSS